MGSLKEVKKQNKLRQEYASDYIGDEDGGIRKVAQSTIAD